MSAGKRRLLLFSGMGGDARLMAPLKLPELDVVTPDHLSPRPGETLAQYAARAAQAHAVGETDVVGGASFGGMIAAQIARTRKVAGVILLGSSMRPGHLSISYRLMERLGRWAPDFILAARSWGPLVRWRFAPIPIEAERCLVAMAADCPPSQLRAFGRMIVDWDGAESLACPVLSIHGDRDRIIPLAAAERGRVLPGAGHAFTLTHAQETIAEIRAFVSGLVPGRIG